MKLPKGFLLSAVNCGIKKKKLDLGLIYCEQESEAVGFFTSNVNPSYSVCLSRSNIHNPIRAVLVNSGNANCFTYRRGLKDTQEIVHKLAKILGVKGKNILIASTGIIGRRLPKDKIIEKFPSLVRNLSKKIDDFSQCILTTDTFKKVSFAKVGEGKSQVRIAGFAKGAGMIYPHLATMLSFILTDVDISRSIFRKIAQEAVEISFNSISIDGCISTNDMVLFISSKRVPLKDKNRLNSFSRRLKGICLDLARMIVADGEGASKFVEVRIKGAKTKEEAKRAAFSIANSNLFKSALYGNNPNWGRIIAAIGAAGIKVKENLSIKSTSLKKREVKIIVDLKRGVCKGKVYTTDLTPRYVKINAGYS